MNKAREDLSINIASYYLQVLYNKELLKIAQLQVELDKEQVNKTEAMVNAGKVPLSQLYDIKAQLAKDEVTLTESQNNVNLALLDLAQSLELERSDRNFDIQTPVIEDAVADNMSSILPPETLRSCGYVQASDQGTTVFAREPKENVACRASGLLPQVKFRG